VENKFFSAAKTLSFKKYHSIYSGYTSPHLEYRLTMTQLQNPNPLAAPDQADKSLAPLPKGGNSAADQVKVTAVTHWTDKLFSFQTNRPPSFRFQSGEFAMIGLADNDGKAVTRAYSIASPHWDDHLEFYSIIVPDGPLTSRLRHIQIGDDIILRPKTTGTLNLARLRDGKRLYLLATGTGFAPFASLIRDPETYERFDEVILVHGCRAIAEFEAIANLKFVEVGEVQDTHAMMRVDITWSNEKSGAASLIVHNGGDIRIDHPHHYSMVLHEIAHALGVKHPFKEDAGFPGDPTEKLLPNSIASYAPDNIRVITQNDINVLQFLYGAPGTNFEGLQSIIDDLDVNLPPDHPYLDIV
jgi:ferredoxin-NADP reductase